MQNKLERELKTLKPSLKKQAELIQELETLIPVARRLEAQDSFKDFIRLYFTGHKLAKSPSFHLEMIRLMALLAHTKAISPQAQEDELTTRVEAKEGIEGQLTQINKEGGGGGEAPRGGG